MTATVDPAWAPGAPAIVTDDFGRRFRTALRSKTWTVGGERLVLIEGIAGGYLAERVALGDAPELPHFRDRHSDPRPRSTR